MRSVCPFRSSYAVHITPPMDSVTQSPLVVRELCLSLFLVSSLKGAHPTATSLGLRGPATTLVYLGPCVPLPFITQQGKRQAFRLPVPCVVHHSCLLFSLSHLFLISASVCLMASTHLFSSLLIPLLLSSISGQVWSTPFVPISQNSLLPT